MKGKFNRVAPAAFAEKTGIPLGWMVISHRWMPDKFDRRRSHGKWFRIKSEHGTSYRVLRFSVNLKGSPPDTPGDLVVDWPAWLELNGYVDDLNGPLQLEISKANWWQLPQLAASHPDPAMRLSSMLGFVSVVLGVLSIILAVVLT